MKTTVAVAVVGLSAGLYGGVSLANTNTGPVGPVTQITIPTNMNLTLEKQSMHAAWRQGRMGQRRGGGNRGMRGGGGRGPGMRGGRGGGRGMRGRGARRAGWRGGRHHHHRDRYYNNWGWTIPAAIATGALISATQSSGNTSNVYACQARYKGYWYQGRFRQGGPCYINVRGRMIAVSNYRPL